MAEKSVRKNENLKSFVIAFLFPTLIGKSLIMYFGLNYSNYPGEGYGYGLFFCAVLTAFNVGRFIWKHRNSGDL